MVCGQEGANTMTRFQEYLARSLTDEDIAYCEHEAAILERNLPFSKQNFPYNPYIDPQNESWLDVVLRDAAYWHDINRGRYCAEMEGLV